MKIRKLILPLQLAAVLIFCSQFIHAGEPIHTWEVYRLTFTGKKTVDNPYAAMPADDNGNDYLQVTFRGKDGDASGKQLTLNGFWNGGNEWCVNFAPPAAGEWSYESVSTDKKLDGRHGKITVMPWSEEELMANPIRHGFLKVKDSGENAGHYFEYADGHPFLWIGDTWWNWTKRDIRFESFKKMVDNRAEKGFTIGQLFVPGNGWGDNSSVLRDDYDVLDASHMQHIEDMISYANSKGITVWVHGWWSRKDLDKKIGAEKMRRWWRYLVHRLGAYNVVWVLAGEYNMYNYGGLGLDFWENLGEMIDKDDPYQHIISVHSTPPYWGGGADAPQWSTAEVLHDQPWLDYNQSQVGHGRYANEMIPKVVSKAYRMEPSKPIVVTEPWYEFVEGNPTGLDIRFAAWGAILSGAAGHTYGGGHVWLADLPESPSGGGTWPREKGYERTTWDYEGAVSMGLLANFFDNIRWWELSPHPELVSDYPQPLCLADPGREYVIYLRYGGYARLKVPDGKYTFYWYDPGTGKKYDKTITRPDSGMLAFRAPESYPGTTHFHDWVLHIERNPE